MNGTKTCLGLINDILELSKKKKNRRQVKPQFTTVKRST
jgi:hypothetical protein